MFAKFSKQVYSNNQDNKADKIDKTDKTDKTDKEKYAVFTDKIQLKAYPVSK